MAGTNGGGYGSRGGDNNEERLRKMVADHLRVSELFAIDTRTPEGLASLTAILGQALHAGLTVGEAQREEARKAAKAKAIEKKRKRDERVTLGALSPRTFEKKRRKDERDAIRKEARSEEEGGEEEAPSNNIGRGGNSNRAGIHWGQEHH
jgi:hypothetical protein